MQLEILPPSVNLSGYRFTVQADGKIVYGLGAIKGVGQNAIDDIIAERERGGPFAGLYDLCKRVDLRKVNRRVLEALIRAGALDVFSTNRAAHMAELPVALKVAEQHGEMSETGQNDLFGLMVSDTNEEDSEAYSTSAEPWP